MLEAPDTGTYRSYSPAPMRGMSANNSGPVPVELPAEMPAAEDLSELMRADTVRSKESESEMESVSAMEKRSNSEILEQRG